MEQERPVEEQVKLDPQQPDNQVEATEDGDDVWEQLMGNTNPFINPVVEEEAPSETPARVEMPAQSGNSEADERSFRYWQSEADKAKNRIKELEERLAQPSTGQLPPRNPDNGQFIPQNPTVQSGNAPQDLSFPDAPEPPKMPVGFSRVEANSDDRSESARYLNDMEAWQADMALYNANKIEFIEAKRQQQTQAQQQEMERREYAQRAYAAQQRQVAELSHTLKEGYQLNDNQVQDFIKQMSDPASISIDNLVRLYAMKQGIQLPNTQQPAPVGKPSSDFLQQRQAQSAPNPMGVFPSSGAAPAKSEIDRLTDEMAAMSSGSTDWL